MYGLKHFVLALMDAKLVVSFFASCLLASVVYGNYEIEVWITPTRTLLVPSNRGIWPQIMGT